MKKNICIKIIILILILGIMFILTGCSNGEENDINKKIDQNIDFLDNKIISVLNLINNISFTDYGVVTEEISGNNQGSKEKASSESDTSSSSDSSDTGSQTLTENKEPTVKTEIKSSNILNNNRDTDWTTLKTNIENLYSSWASIVLDLYKLNINNNDIIGFEKKLDETIISIKNEDKQSSIDNLTMLYSYLPKYLEAYSDSKRINIMKTKYNIIEAYSIAQKEDWELIRQKVSDAENNFISIVNNIENNSNQVYINKTYILIKEMENSIDLKDLDLFYIKYKAVMSEIEFIS